jgi:hypothetical protein
MAVQDHPTKEDMISVTFTVTTPTNHVAKDFDDARTIWSGTLEAVS